jgi:hypothetical protein
MEGLFGAILAAFGSIASVISLLRDVTGRREVAHGTKVLLFFIAVLTTASAAFSFMYYNSTNNERIQSRQWQAASDDAWEFFRTYKYPIAGFSGENEGIVRAGMIVFEKYKQLFPQNYERLVTDVEEYRIRSRDGDRVATLTSARMIYDSMRFLARKPKK